MEIVLATLSIIFDIDWLSAKSFQSGEIPVTLAIHRSSYLGATLFIILYPINDPPLTIESSPILMYADDVKLFSSFNPRRPSWFK